MKIIEIISPGLQLFIGGCLAILFAAAMPQRAAAQHTPGHDNRYLSLQKGQVSLVRMPGVHRVAIGDAKVVSYKTVDEESILLIGAGKGRTNIHIWGEGDRQLRYWVSVDQRDITQEMEIASTLLKGVERVTVSQLDERVVIEGEASETDMIKVNAVKEMIPNTVVSVKPRKLVPAQAVRIDALLVEISRGDLTSIGIDWADSMSGPSVGLHKTFQSDNRFTIFERDDDDVNEGIVSTIPVGDRSFFSYFGITSHILSRINLLSEDGRATILSSPRLTTLDGQEARFQVGGQFPIPFIDSNGALTVERQDYGVLLNILPVIEGNLVNMNIKVELSDIDRSVQVNGIPGLKRRNTETMVQLRNNETIAISGLFQVDESLSDSKVPFLGDVPFVGKLFASENRDYKDREVVVLITPKLIAAGDENDRGMSEFARDSLRRHRTKLTIDQSLVE
jgi:pilus assembly protein CpaC